MARGRRRRGDAARRAQWMAGASPCVRRRASQPRRSTGCARDEGPTLCDRGAFFRQRGGRKGPGRGSHRPSPLRGTSGPRASAYVARRPARSGELDTSGSRRLSRRVPTYDTSRSRAGRRSSARGRARVRTGTIATCASAPAHARAASTHRRSRGLAARDPAARTRPIIDHRPIALVLAIALPECAVATPSTTPAPSQASRLLAGRPMSPCSLNGTEALCRTS
jgi:hypothetical protein